MKKRTIAIVAGGDSSELVVSLRSAQGIYSFIDKERYNLYIVEMEGKRWEVVLPDGSKTPIDRNDFSFMESGEKKNFDFAYITIHGTPGENGILQGYFDLIGMPYSSCNVLVSAITFNKFTCNQYLKGFGIRVSESMILRKGFEILDEEVINKVGLPCFIKPNAGGSSFGVTKVKTKEDIQPAIEKAFGESDEVMIEAFMKGTEITCGCYKTKNKEVVFPIRSGNHNCRRCQCGRCRGKAFFSVVHDTVIPVASPRQISMGGVRYGGVRPSCRSRQKDGRCLDVMEDTQGAGRIYDHCAACHI